MKQIAYCLFETQLGRCGIAWSQPEASGAQAAVSLLQLPEATAAMTESRIAQSCGARQASAPPPEIARVITRVRKHLEGELQDLRDVTVDLEGQGLFARRVYEAAREIPAGETRTYGELARTLRRPAAARAVGHALGRNPVPIIVPCHRILAAGRKPGGFSASGGRVTKARLLAIERAAFGRRPGQLSLLHLLRSVPSP